MISGARAAGPTGGNHRLASAALGVATALIATAALATGTWGPATMNRMLAGGSVSAPPPLPAADISIQAGANPIGDGTVPIGAGSAPISPVTPVTVAVQHGTLQTVQVTDTKSGQQVAGTLTPDSRTWRTTAPLSYGDTYQVAATAVGEDRQVVRESGTVSTVRPAALTAAALRPSTGATVGVGQPLVVRFTRPVADRAAAVRALSVSTSPEQTGSWYWMSATEAHYRPASYWQPGTTIQLNANLFGADLGKGAFGQANRTATVRVHDSWVAKADGRSKVMQIFHNGTLAKTMPISLGSPTNPSHSGPHVVSDKKPTMIMDSCTYGVCEGDPGYYKEKVDLDVRISNDGEFVHSAPWSVGQQGSSNVSHGCVNLSPANAQWFFDHFNIGDVVEITNSGGPRLPVWDTYGDWTLPWSEWQAGGKS
ncbi:MAG TPA: Ig-like domain-containing protein [Pseudonocardia sp.]|uniref:L,D-transpeptidase n=1 Tax=Pseudonocardia sp. TaxID=60912 RepID=UPI002B830D92|nr:Ig-like domain-containing protein [Pseudonocardia sp.]HTF49686.1 Ig-like domain-containing protein [Pseudonocardia sp.]